MTGWLVRDEKRFVGLTQLLPGLPLMLYGLATSELVLRDVLLIMATVVSLFGVVRVGLTAWRLGRLTSPVPVGLRIASRAYLFARTVLPLLGLYIGVAVYGAVVSEDPRTLFGFLGLYMVFDGAINLGQAAIVIDWERRNPARLIRANHLLYLAQ
jgi:hypothetical protein